MATHDIEFHFGVTLEGGENHFKYYDLGTTTWHEFELPAGTYYFKHDTTAKQISTALTSLIGASFPGFDVVLYGRQHEWTMDASGDYLNLLATNNDDGEKLARLLGLYDNTGDFEAHETTTVTNGYISQVSLASWYASGGKVWESYDLLGFEEFNNEIYRTEGGAVSQGSGSKQQILDPLTLTCVSGDSIRGGLPHGTQAVLGVTANPTWTTSVQNASYPPLFEPKFYAELGGKKIEYSLIQPIMKSDARMEKAGWTGLFNLTLHLLVGDDLT